MKLLTVAVPVVIVALMLAALGGVSGVTNETRSVERAPASAQQTLVACVPPEAMNGAAADIPMTSVPSPHGCTSRFGPPGGPWLTEC